MAVTKKVKQQLIKKFGSSEKDTGKTEVQIALLTEHIKDLTKHLSINRKDNHTRYGLLMQVGKRRKLLRYLAKNDIKRYRELISELGLRK